MVNRQQLALNDAAEWLGDWHPLSEQLGSASLLAFSSVSHFLELPEVTSFDSIHPFLHHYQQDILRRFELPAIQASHAHAERGELRELIELDRRLGNEPLLGLFAEPSRRVGRAQLQRLRPLRDQRTVQRYLRAVGAGEAEGWHTLVYGLTLAVYSLPLRQGLLGYAHQVTRGYIYMAAENLKLSELECRLLFDEISPGFAPMIEELFSPLSCGA
jgi:urease accessory protein UreF